MVAARRVVKAPKPPVELPPEFAAALKKNKAANAAYAAFSPSCKREYIEWIADAKRPETRDRRIAQAMEWIGEGKQRNWKYQSLTATSRNRDVGAPGRPHLNNVRELE